MNTIPVDVMGLFSDAIQYIIPLFQRHYVWNQEEQWDLLWEDIEKKALYRRSESQIQRTHFTGTIVVQHKQTNVNEVKKYEIIDGQQRLTTFQVILCALRDVCTLHELGDIKEGIDRYVVNHVLNRGTLSNDSGNEKYKLIPTEFDRASFIALVDGRVNESNGLIRQTYCYFEKKVRFFVNGDRTNASVLYDSILSDFDFVQIRLEEEDEPERIFESLNARAKSLLQFDLLRNNLFLRARTGKNKDRDSLYEDYWKHFEEPYWEKKATVARKKITLSELFFQHFLMAKLGEVKVAPLFNVYRKRIAGKQGVEHELSELKRYSELYQEMTNCCPDSEIGQAMSFYKTFDITTLHPFILFAVNELKVSGSELVSVFRILESYTIRRMVCIPSNGTRNYTKLVSKLIHRLNGKHFDLKNFVNLLVEERANATRWPTDDEVVLSLLFPTNYDRREIRYILYRIEMMKREENRLIETNVLSFDRRLSLEHIMPQGWQDTWSLPLTTEENGKPSFDSKDRILYEHLFSREYRDTNPQWQTDPSEDGLADESYSSAFSVANQRRDFLQSIGNLTLVTELLNSNLSNRPFSQKKACLSQNSQLILNREICEHDTWDYPQIRERGSGLLTYFRSIWPSAASFAQRIGKPS